MRAERRGREIKGRETETENMDKKETKDYKRADNVKRSSKK